MTRERLANLTPEAEEMWKRKSIETILALTPRADDQRSIAHFLNKPPTSGAGPSGYSPAAPGRSSSLWKRLLRTRLFFADNTMAAAALAAFVSELLEEEDVVPTLASLATAGVRTVDDLKLLDCSDWDQAIGPAAVRRRLCSEPSTSSGILSRLRHRPAPCRVRPACSPSRQPLPRRPQPRRQEQRSEPQRPPKRWCRVRTGSKAA